MFFKKLIYLLLIVNFTFSCKTKCKEHDMRIYNKWSDSNVLYELRKNGTYSVKYLRAYMNPNDSITNTDSAFGRLIFAPCKNFITFEQTARKPKGKDTIIYQIINAGTWEYELLNDSVLKYKSQTSVGQFFRYK